MVIICDEKVVLEKYWSSKKCWVILIWKDWKKALMYIKKNLICYDDKMYFAFKFIDRYNSRLK